MICEGKDYEHHERAELEDGPWPFRWRCLDCGGTGTVVATLAKVMALYPLLCRLQEQMLHEGAVFLLPSDTATGKLFECLGLPVYRVRGIERPTIALGAGALDVATGKALAVRITQDPS